MLIDEEIRFGFAFITTEGEGGEGAGGEGAGEGSGEGGGDDLATLFTVEEIEAKKTAATELKAEEERRSALSPEELKAEDDAKAEEVKLNGVPEKYDFKIPEGTTVDQELMDEVSTFAKENNLSMKEAQRIADLGAKLMTKQTDLRTQQFEDIKAQWLDTAKKDKEIGADVSKGADSVAARSFNTIATPEMKEMVDQYGIGNHPEMLRMFYRLSSLMKDDAMHMPGSGAGAGSSTGAEGTVGGIFNHPSRQRG